jgi:cytochrome c-type biogenesis protein CcmF
MVAVTLFSNHLPSEMVARVLSVMASHQLRIPAVHVADVESVRAVISDPADGRDLNPLLQDPAMVAHPPMLYMGYVGFAWPSRLRSRH